MQRLRTRKRVFTIRFPQEVRDYLEEFSNTHDVAVADIVRELVNIPSLMDLKDRVTDHGKKHAQPILRP